MEETEEISLLLYQYLSDKIVGSENVVKFRRKFYKALDASTNRLIKTVFKQISSGSLAEGMALPGSDYDVMFVDTKFITVYEDTTDIETNEQNSNTIPLIMETKYAQPGFVLLRVSEQFSRRFTIPTEFGNFFSGRLFKMAITDLNPYININGPCLTMLECPDRLDVAFTHRCKTWPKVAINWLRRHRSSGWPTEKLISDICKQGILLVPIGSKSDSQEDNPIEWRISFSVPEKMLIHSWNHTQFLCYALLKIVIKDIVKENKNVNRLVCSYFLKTSILWLSEECSYRFWRPENLYRCFSSCMERLIYWYECNYLPNYFIPEHNMIDRYIPGQSKPELVSLLRTIHSIGWTSLLNCNSMKGIINPDVLYRPFVICGFENIDFNLELEPFQFENESQKVESNYILAKSPNISIKMRLFYLFKMAQNSNKVAQQSFPTTTSLSNKLRYQQGKEWLSYALIGTKSDMVSGWLLIALFFYRSNHYLQSLMIMKYVFLYFYSGKYSRLACLRKMLRQTFFRELRSLNIFPIIDDNVDIDDSDDFIIPGKIPPVVFLHYLSFLCHHRLDDLTRSQQDLQYLMAVVNDGDYIKTLNEKGVSCAYIANCFYDIGDKQNAWKWLSVSQKLNTAIRDKS